ncbi:MAG: VOC family protein [Clostridiales Family XIII bacterium]|jgi:PhnB protein|nr:VOC family protein [Clostridiales Family XIII bacterium]
MIEVSPVLSFYGDCEEAFEYYRAVFGGEYQFIYRYKDVDPESVAKGYGEKIMHVSLPLMKNVNLMGSDILDGDAGGFVGSDVSIGLRLNNEEETLRLFDALAKGGAVVVPLEKVFYADLYGALIDRFGIGWSFNCNIGREAGI